MNKEIQPNSSNNPEWNSDLIHDLSFIKKYLRYPISKKTIIPVARTVITLLSLSGLTYWTFIANHSKFIVAAILGFAVPTLISITAIMKLVQSLKFISVPTDLFAAGNMQLLKNFLESERLIVFRHPEAPEVFQIISKDVNAHNYKGGEQREVLIFIADDKRILLNSHFTAEKQTFFQQIRKGHHREMAAMLQRYIDSINTTDAGKAVKRH